MTLPVEEFLRRFLLHLLPRGFVRIRNFGFLANRRRAPWLPLCTHLLASANQPKPVPSLAPRPVRALAFCICPICGGPMRVIERLSAAQIQLPRSAASPRACCMKPQPQSRSILLLRHATAFCASQVSSQSLSHPPPVTPITLLAQNPLPSLIQPALHTPALACHPAHPTSAPFKSHSQGLPSSRCIESAHALQCD